MWLSLLSLILDKRWDNRPRNIYMYDNQIFKTHSLKDSKIKFKVDLLVYFRYLYYEKIKPQRGYDEENKSDL